MKREERYHLIQELHDSGATVSEQVKVYEEETGRSRSDYFRVKRRLHLIEECDDSGNPAGEQDCYFCSKEGGVFHHIDQDRSNNEPHNLMPLCRGCHTKVHLLVR